MCIILGWNFILKSTVQDVCNKILWGLSNILQLIHKQWVQWGITDFNRSIVNISHLKVCVVILSFIVNF